jgi:chorismate synthase
VNPVLSRLSLRTAGESHGPAMVAILEGVPRGLSLDQDAVNEALRRRQGGAGRGGRQRIEHDRIEVMAGVRRGVTIGSPLCLQVRNRDASIDDLPEPVRPRPGHADLAGCYRYLDRDIRSTLERASARETCARVAAGAVAAQLLEAAGASAFGFVRSVGVARLPDEYPGALAPADLAGLRIRRDRTALYTLDDEADAAMLQVVQEAARARTTVGGVVEVHVAGLLPGLGSCMQWHERLDARLGAALLSIPAIKAVEIGEGLSAAQAYGANAHDAVAPASPLGGEGPGSGVWRRESNRAGGLEGGMTNGEPLIVRASMKPIATQRDPLASVDLATGEPAPAGYERADVCAVSAASVVAEAMVALVVADAMLQRVGGESLSEFVSRSRELWRAVGRLSRRESSNAAAEPPSADR